MRPGFDSDGQVGKMRIEAISFRIQRGPFARYQKRVGRLAQQVCPHIITPGNVRHSRRRDSLSRTMRILSYQDSLTTGEYFDTEAERAIKTFGMPHMTEGHMQTMLWIPKKTVEFAPEGPHQGAWVTELPGRVWLTPCDYRALERTSGSLQCSFHLRLGQGLVSPSQM